jgi:hypothetical protein
MNEGPQDPLPTPTLADLPLMKAAPIHVLLVDFHPASREIKQERRST